MVFGVAWPVANTVEYHSCCEDAVTIHRLSEFFPFRMNFLPPKNWNFKDGANLCCAIAGAVQHCRVHVVQAKAARVGEENCIAEMHLLSQSVQFLDNQEVVAQDAGVCVLMGPRAIPSWNI